MKKNKALKSFILFLGVLAISFFYFSNEVKALEITEIEQPDYSYSAPATTTDWTTSYNYLQKLGTRISGELENVVLFQKNDQTNYDIDQVCLYYATSSSYQPLQNLGNCVKHGVNKRLTYEAQPYDFTSQSIIFDQDLYYAYAFYGGLMEDQTHAWAEEQFKGQPATSTEDGYVYGEYTHGRTSAPKLKHPYFWFEGLSRIEEVIYGFDYSSVVNIPNSYSLSCCEDEICRIQVNGLDNNTTLNLYDVSNTTSTDCTSITITGDPLNEISSTTYTTYNQQNYLDYNFGENTGDYYLCLNTLRPYGQSYAYLQLDIKVINYASTSDYCILKAEQKPTFSFCEDPCADLEEGIWSDIFCGFKQAMCWFVEPQPEAFKQLKNNSEKIKLEFPFNLYFGLTDSIQRGLSSTTINNMDGTFGFVMYNGSDYYVQPVLNSSTITNFFGEEKAQDFRIVFVYILWSIAVFYIIFRLTKK